MQLAEAEGFLSIKLIVFHTRCRLNIDLFYSAHLHKQIRSNCILTTSLLSYCKLQKIYSLVE